MKEKFTKLFGALMLVALLLGLVMPFQSAAAQEEIPGTVGFVVAATDGTDLAQVNLAITTDATSLPNITFYNIYRSFTESGTKTMLSNNLLPAGLVTPFSDTTAIPGTVYWYWVEACDGVSCTGMIGNDGWRAVTGFPAGSTVAATVGTYLDRIEVLITLGGASPLPVVGGYYKIERSKAGAAAWTTVGTPTTLLFKDTTAPGMTPTTNMADVTPTYDYQVDVCGVNKCASQNAPVVAKLATAAPGRHAQLPDPAPFTSASGSKKVTLTFNSSVGAMNYYGQRAFGSQLAPASPLALEPAAKPDVAGTIYFKDDTTAVPGNDYTYYVWACATATNCSHKLQVGGRAEPVVTTPANFKVSKGDETTAPAAGVDITFTALPDAGWWLGYELNRSDDAAGLVNVVTTQLNGTPNPDWPTPNAPYALNDNGVNPGQSYYFWLKVCDYHTAPATCATSSKLEGWGKVPTPASLSLVSTTSGVSGTWPAVAGPNVFYRGWRNTTNSMTGALGPKNIPGTGLATISGTDTTGTVGTTYWYFIQACVGTRCSAPIFGSGMKLP